jgi:1,4-alpha-glucan branching enzyme
MLESKDKKTKTEARKANFENKSEEKQVAFVRNRGERGKGIFTDVQDLWSKLPKEYTPFRSTKITRGRQEEEQTSPIEFTFFAPYSDKAAVRGSFSNWEDIMMEKGDDGFFRLSVDLPDGDHEYKFCVTSHSFWQDGQWICVTDPLATDINEQSGQDNAVLHVRDGKIQVDDYQWRHDMNPLPSDNELVIYEMHVGEFGDTFQGVIERLDYLAGLGVNAIELMPVTEYPGDNSWGYNPRHFFAVESAYGETQDFKRLVDECHARGIRVILDLVCNHADTETPLAKIDHNYWFHDPESNQDDHQFGPKFDYNHWDDNLKMFPARHFMNQVAFYWVTEFHLDGIRFDATALINNFDFLHWVGEEVKRLTGIKPFYLVAEHLPVDPAIVGMDGPMDGLWHDYFYWQMTANLREGEFMGWQPLDWEKTLAAIEPARNGIIGATAAVNYLSNHDHNRLMFELGTAGILNEKAFRKLKLGFAVLMTSVGVPMIWMGEEIGQSNEKSMEKRPFDAPLMQNESNADLLHYVSGLTFLRKNTGALKSENIEFIHMDTEKCVLAWKRWDDNGSLVVAVANFSDNFYGDYQVPNMPDGEWHEYIFNYDKVAEGGVLTDMVAESSCKIYVKK